MHNSLLSHIFDKTHIMKEASDAVVIIVGIIGLAIFAYVIILGILSADAIYQKRYIDLRNFKYYVENCTVDSESRNIIKERIRLERIRSRGGEAKYLALVNEIAKIYVKRFTEFIANERGNKNNAVK